MEWVKSAAVQEWFELGSCFLKCFGRLFWFLGVFIFGFRIAVLCRFYYVLWGLIFLFLFGHFWAVCILCLGAVVLLLTVQQSDFLGFVVSGYPLA